MRQESLTQYYRYPWLIIQEGAGNKNWTLSRR
jgi:hypothetical protein